MFKQVPPCLHGLFAHSWTSSLQVVPLKPSGQTHLNLLPFGRIEHVPPFLHGDVAHKLDFSQFLPKRMKLFVSFMIIKTNKIILPENPSGHLHSYSLSDFRKHFPLFRQGDELQAVSSDISQRLAENPTGHLHWKLACPSFISTSQVPPFWHLGAVRQGFAYSQNSPT